MRRVSFLVAAGAVEDMLDGLIWRLPAGLRLEPAGADTVRVEFDGADELMPSREVIERAVGRALDGYEEQPVSADWRARRAGIRRVIAERIVLRAPQEDAAPGGMVDVVLDWAGRGFGLGTHPTTRMCAELLLDVEPVGGVVDIGCGIGALAIVAAKLGFAPVVGIDLDERAVAQARENAERNGVAVDFRVGDVTESGAPAAPTVTINVPREVHASVIAGLDDDVKTVIASGVTGADVAATAARYEGAGFAVQRTVAETQGSWAALLLERGDG